ncbi:MAG: penicillin acylase family protein, partial [Alphaproteobacteria bacterium]|nr:penicillin acylase family protein [Alphaproteobacteria bacterium]
MRLALKILIGLVIVIGLSAGGGWLWLRGSLPNHAGEFKVQGLGEAVRIVRDRNGIPHIQAKSRNDAFFTLGFVHAQDRLWQLEMNRRIGAGRLAEMLGEAALPTDRFLRTLGVHALAERTFPRLTQDAQAAFNAYAAGINAHIASRKGALPPEFLILGVKPEPWKPADSIVWMKMMAWDLGGNWQAELQRARLAKRLSPERIAELLPPYPGEAPVPLPNLKALYEAAPLERAYAALPPVEEANGSNNWALAGGRSATGKPLLANDPHLGLAAPAIWYLAHVSAPGMEFIGATLPGIPSVVLGRTKRLAIAFTNTGPDVQDLYVEKVDLADPSRYLTPDGSRPFETRREVIKVKGRPDEVITVRTTRHGPVISDIN